MKVRVKDWMRRLLPAAWCAVVVAAVVLCEHAHAGERPPEQKGAEPKPILVLKDHGGPIRSVAYSADGKSLFTAGGKSIRLWDLATGKLIREVVRDDLLTYDVTFSHDRKRIAYLTYGGRNVHVVEPMTGKALRKFTTMEQTGYYFRTALSPDGGLLAAVSPDPCMVHVWEVVTGRKLHERRVPDGVEHGLTFSTDGRVLAVGSGDATARLWDVRSGKELHKLIHPADSYRIRHVIFSPDGKLLATVAWGANPLLCMWEVSTGKQLRRLGADLKRESPRLRQERDRLLLEDDPVSKLVLRLTIDAIAFSPDSRWLASAGEDSSTRLWEVATGLEAANWRTPSPYPLAFSPDGKGLTSGGNVLGPKDGWASSVAIWDRASVCRRSHRVAPLRPRDLEACWEELGSADTPCACRSIWTLVAWPLLTNERAEQYLRAVPAANPAKISQAIADLDSSHFAVRKKAFAELAALSDKARPALEAALLGNPGAEGLKRIRELLARIEDPLDPSRLRHARLVEVLEHTGDTHARRLLTSIAGGALGDTASQAASDALGRLKKRYLKD